MAYADQTGVKALLANEVRRTQTHIDNVDEILLSLKEAAEKLAKSEFAGGVDTVKDNFKKLLEVQHGLKIHVQATSQLRQDYREPSEEEETDFSALMESATQQIRGPSAFDAERSTKYTNFLEDIRDFCPDEAGEDGDDDLRIERGEQLAKNVRCPVSGRVLLDIREPVEDRVGYVYEKEDFLRIFNHSNTVQCPYAGASHAVSRSELKPARKVLRAQKRAQKNSLKQMRADEAEIMDV